MSARYDASYMHRQIKVVAILLMVEGGLEALDDLRHRDAGRLDVGARQVEDRSRRGSGSLAGRARSAARGADAAHERSSAVGPENAADRPAPDAGGEMVRSSPSGTSRVRRLKAVRSRRPRSSTATHARQ